jgi:hypothetical protein
MAPLRALPKSLAAAALAAALLACSGDKAPPKPDAAAAQDVAAPAEPYVDPAIKDFQPEDPAAVARAAEREEARGRFRTMREAFTQGGRASPRDAARLQAAVAKVRPPEGGRWQVACRGRACRVSVAGAAEPGAPRPERGAWQPLLAGAPDVQQVADRMAVDPDGTDAAVYVPLAVEEAAPGDDLVAALERELVSSPDAKACATNAQVTGTVKYELRVDGTGFTYRVDGDVPWAVVDCVNDVLTGMMRGIPVPPTAKSAERVVALRL